MSTCNGIVGAGSNLLNGDLTVVIGRESHEVNAHPDGIYLETATVNERVCIFRHILLSVYLYRTKVEIQSAF